MRYILIIAAFAAFGNEVLAQQPIGIINAPSGQVVIRSGQGPGFGVVDRINEGQPFYYWPEDDEEWWYTEFLDQDSDHEGGFVQKDLVGRYYPDEDPPCQCSEEGMKPVMFQNLTGLDVILCGELLQRDDKGNILIRKFSVTNCQTSRRVAYYGSSETCKVRKVNDGLVVESLKLLPVGPDWSKERTVISTQEIKNQNGTVLRGPRKYAVDTRITEAQNQTLLSELDEMRNKGNLLEVNYLDVLEKLLSAALSDHKASEDILREANGFFGFDFKKFLYPEYTVAIALLDWKNETGN